MNETSRVPRSAGANDLIRVLAHCNQGLQRAAPAGASPVLRLERGAGLIRGARAQHVGELLEALLGVAAPRLYVPPAQSAVARVNLRTKVRVTLSMGGTGLLAQLHYFGATPADTDLRRLFAGAAVGAGGLACALSACCAEGIVVESSHESFAMPESVMALARAPTVLARGEVCLRAVWHEPPRRFALVRVMAGRRELAVPMFSIEQVVSEDAMSGERPSIRSLANCLDEEPSPSSQGRPALLILRRRGPALALRVEALLGHGSELVQPVGPVLHCAPWILGVIDDGDARAPILVVDPLALPGLLTPPQ